MVDLKAFLNDPVNSVTRERLFYNRLYYDLKLAAVRRGYALTLYEPEVDRDGFDVVLDDGDATRFVQLKTVLATSSTTTWEIPRRFLRPEAILAERYGVEPAAAGKGGAVVLIGIDLSGAEPVLSYRVTDFSIMMALSSVLRRRISRAPGAAILGTRRQVAEASWRDVLRDPAAGKVRLNGSTFLRARGPSGVLSLLGLHSELPAYQPATTLATAHRLGFATGPGGGILPCGDLVALALARRCAADLLSASDEPGLAVHPAL